MLMQCTPLLIIIIIVIYLLSVLQYKERNNYNIGITFPREGSILNMLNRLFIIWLYSLLKKNNKVNKRTRENKTVG